VNRVPVIAADLKSLLRRSKLGQEFQIEGGAEVINLPVPLCFRVRVGVCCDASRISEAGH
jgi:hypothetical protein